MSDGSGVGVLLVSDDERRHDALVRALADIGQVVWARDVSSALEELSVGPASVTIIDGSFPRERLVDILGALGDPDRAIIWVEQPAPDLVEYGGSNQILFEAGDEAVAAAVARTIEAQRLKVELEDQRRKLERFDRVSKVVSRVRHEINNPLTSLMAEAQLLLMDDNRLSDDQKRAVETIEEMARRIRDLVKELHELKVAR